MYGSNNTSTGYYTHETQAFFLPLKFDLELGPIIYIYWNQDVNIKFLTLAGKKRKILLMDSFFLLNQQV